MVVPWCDIPWCDVLVVPYCDVVAVVPLPLDALAEKE